MMPGMMDVPAETSQTMEPSIPTALFGRQMVTLPAPALTTSSFNWWPYPSWGASTTSMSVASIPSILAGSTTSASSTADSIIPSQTLSATATRLAASSGYASNAPTGSIIHISALPPANSSSSYNNLSGGKRQDSSSSFDVAYLSPLFAVLGALAGVLCTWLVLRCVARRRARRAREWRLEPGPRYAPPPEAGTEEADALARGESDSGAPSAWSSTSTAQARGITKGQWLARSATASTHRSGPSSSSELRHAGANLDPPAVAYVNGQDAATEHDPFLDDLQGMDGGEGTAASSSRFMGDMNSPTTRTVDDGDGDAVPYDTLRHTSIRRGILERLKFGTLRRQEERSVDEEDRGEMMSAVSRTPSRQASRRNGHKRQDSDLMVDGLSQPASAQSTRTPSRANSVARSGLISSPLLSPPGFRIIEEDTEADLTSLQRIQRALSSHRDGMSRLQTPLRDDASRNWLSPWSASPSKQVSEDNYTAIPVRRTAAEKRSSPFSMSAGVRSLTPGTAAPAPAMTRVDSSILPSSPPRIMSPPLESKLFFGAISPDFGSVPVLDLHVPGIKADSSTANINKPQPVPIVRQSHKLHTKREPPLLPYPSSASSSPYRNRLKKSATQSTSPPSVAASPPSSPPRQTPAQRYNARHSALSKVDQILSHSWSQRDVSVDLYVGSPNRFGALPASSSLSKSIDIDMPESPLRLGIQQRLEVLQKRRDQTR